MDPQQQNQPPADQVPQTDGATANSDEYASNSEANVKQQVVEKVNGAKNVLVTVGSNPSVDELASALGLTFLLGKLGKHVTAVFSGTTPPAIDFLDPDKTFERSVDSLRDFIIALDKEKADKLRYKVEDDVVKVFITPYKTTISEKDLQFSQGDYNVDVVIAIGISKRDDLDKAIVAHGRILHDAEVLTINASDKKSNLGSVDWSDTNSSSIAEMLVSVSESFGSGLIDEQISTAFLTGIVAETNRFSNEKTSPKVMTMAAQLMAAGANQQLIASNLRQEGMISESIRTKESDKPHDEAEMVLDHSDNSSDSKRQSKESGSKPQGQKPQKPAQPAQKDSGNKPQKQNNSNDDSKSNNVSAVKQPPQTPTQPLTPKPEPKVDKEPTIEPVKSQPVEPTPPNNPTPQVGTDKTNQTGKLIQPDQDKPEAQRPSFGGTLNATTAQAEQEKMEQEARDRESNNQTLEHGGADTENSIEAARAALEDVTSEMPFDPSNNPTQSIGAEQLPPIDHGEPQLTPITPLSSASTEQPSPDAEAGKMQEDAEVKKSAAEAEPSPVDDFMKPHEVAPQEPNMANATTAPPSAPINTPPPLPGSDLPPLPPMPPLPGAPQDGASMPPSQPGQPVDPTAGFKPTVGPEFMQNMQSQNSWTEAGQDVASKQAEKDAQRQAKLDKLGEQYDSAVDKNREMQGLPPINDDHSTFPLPPTK